MTVNDAETTIEADPHVPLFRVVREFEAAPAQVVAQAFIHPRRKHAVKVKGRKVRYRGQRGQVQLGV